jgi:hypothetical protein
MGLAEPLDHVSEIVEIPSFAVERQDVMIWPMAGRLRVTLGAGLVDSDEPQVSFWRCEADGVPIDQHQNAVDCHEVGAVRFSMGYDDGGGRLLGATVESIETPPELIDMRCEQSARLLAERSFLPGASGVVEERVEVGAATDVRPCVVRNSDRRLSGVKCDQHVHHAVSPGRIALEAEGVRSALQVVVDGHRVSVPEAHRRLASVGEDWCYNEPELRVITQSTAGVE